MASNYLILNSRDEYLRIELDKIIAFESEGNYTNIVLASKVRAMVGMNLGQMKELLMKSLGKEASRFARVGKRHIVNLDLIYRINIPQQKLYLSDGDRFMYTANVSKEALKQLRAYLVGRPNED